MSVSLATKAITSLGILLFAGGILTGNTVQEDPPQLERMSSITTMTAEEVDTHRQKVAEAAQKAAEVKKVAEAKKAAAEKKAAEAKKKAEAEKKKAAEAKKLAEEKKAAAASKKAAAIKKAAAEKKAAEAKAVAVKKTAVAKAEAKKQAASVTSTKIKKITNVNTPSSTTSLSPKAYAQKRVASMGYDSSHYTCLVKLWTKESSWNYKAANPTTSARGIAQTMMSIHFGSNWSTSAAGVAFLNSPEKQIDWGLNYIKGTYGTPCAAWGHSQNVGWY